MADLRAANRTQEKRRYQRADLATGGKGIPIAFQAGKIRGKGIIANVSEVDLFITCAALPVLRSVFQGELIYPSWKFAAAWLVWLTFRG